MMEELLTDEMKQMIEEIQKLLDELDKDKVNQMLEEMKMTNKDLEDQLDRSLELLNSSNLNKSFKKLLKS